tara:strand:- start:967 stop:2772 length:1806 start_codon:yes stop_codon:yes gene_type:complete
MEASAERAFNTPVPVGGNCSGGRPCVSGSSCVSNTCTEDTGGNDGPVIDDDPVIDDSPDEGECVADYQKCGGQDYTGSSRCCSSNSTCISDSIYYSQCEPEGGGGGGGDVATARGNCTAEEAQLNELDKQDSSCSGTSGLPSLCNVTDCGGNVCYRTPQTKDEGTCRDITGWTDRVDTCLTGYCAGGYISDTIFNNGVPNCKSQGLDICDDYQFGALIPNWNSPDTSAFDYQAPRSAVGYDPDNDGELKPDKWWTTDTTFEDIFCGGGSCPGTDIINPNNTREVLSKKFTVASPAFQVNSLSRLGRDRGTFLQPSGEYYNGQCTGALLAYQCLDWTALSNRMEHAASVYKTETGNDVFFGVGTLGGGVTLGSCYYIAGAGDNYDVPGSSYGDDPNKDLIVQAINTGGDVDPGNFDLQIGVGGQGIHNACQGSSLPGNPQFEGSDCWGVRFGGVKNKDECPSAKLIVDPPTDAVQYYDGTDVGLQVDNVKKLCEDSFDQNLRVEGGNNWKINIKRVECPDELVNVTMFNPDPDCKFSGGGDGDDATEGYFCKTPGRGDWDYTNVKLSRMMDCRKPSAAVKSNIPPNVLSKCIESGSVRPSRS